MTIYGGDFEKQEQIGKGGMAWVFKGRQISLDRPVAIKVMYPQFAEDAQLRKRFLQEGLNAANMEHENIVRVYRAGDDGEPYIAMELIDGLDLRKWLDQYGQPPIEIALIIFRDICRGLEHAHERKVVHRDIKPSNVMLSRAGMVKLMDFGLARRLDRDTSLTTPGMILGTWPYMSPEQAAGREQTAASDIFSFGILGYELLGGARPFQGETESEVSIQIQRSTPRPLGSLNPLVPKPVVTTIHRMLEKLPERRMHSVSEVLQQLEDAMERLGISRDRAMLKKYARDPGGESSRLRNERLTLCLNQALNLENMGLSRIDEAIDAYGQVLALDPSHTLAKDNRKKLVKKREDSKVPVGPDTLIIPPDEDPDAEHDEQPPPPVPWWRRPESYVAATIVVAFGIWLIWAKPWQKRGDSEAAGADSTLQPRTTSTVIIRTQPEGASVALDDRAAQTAPARFEDVTTGLHSFHAEQSGYHPLISSLALVVARDTTLAVVLEPQSPPDVVPPPPAPATLSVETSPAGARVTVDGRGQRASPARFEDLRAGMHTIRAALDRYQPRSMGVRLWGRDTVVRLALTAEALPQPVELGHGTLQITATPAPAYFLDGVGKGSGDTPRVLTEVREGLHTVRLEHPKYDTKEFRNVRVGSDSTTTLSWDFHTHAAKINVVKSGFYWGWIILDGRELQLQTPRVISVKSGVHKVRVVKQGYKVTPSEDVEVDVKPGETYPVEFTVTPP